MPKAGALFSAFANYVYKRSSRWLEELERSPPLPYEPVKDASLYLHVPFCPNLCKFCHFVRYPYNEEKAKKYYKKLISDVEEAYSKDICVTEVYIGGGSPSAQPEMLGELLDELWSKWKVPISVEVNPNDVVKGAMDHVDPKKVARVSMGIQSFDGKRLKELGRPVSPETNYEALEIVASKGYKTFNVDIVWGLESVAEDAEKAFTSKANQVTFYPLMPFPGRGAKAEERGFEVYEEIVRLAEEHGFERENAWTFSKGNDMVDEYICDTENFLGLGVSSFSLLNNVAYVNTFSVEKYMESGWFPAEHAVVMKWWDLKCFKWAFKLHSNPKKFLLPGEFGWYLGVITLRELFTALGEFRKRMMARASKLDKPKAFSLA